MNDTVRPTQYFPLHTSSIRSLVVITIPPFSRSEDGSTDLESESNLIATTGYEGTSYVVDLRDPGAPYLLSHERCTSPPYSSLPQYLTYTREERRRNGDGLQSLQLDIVEQRPRQPSRSDSNLTSRIRNDSQALFPTWCSLGTSFPSNSECEREN